MNREIDRVAVGEVVNTHGIKGEVKVRLLTDFPERFKSGALLTLVKSDTERVLTIEDVRPFKNMVLLKFHEIPDLSAAEELKGGVLQVSKAELTQLPEDTYYVFDIIGMTVLTEQGLNLGQVKDVIQTGSNDVYIVQGQEKDYMIPAIKKIVTRIDTANREITIRPIEGLLDL